MTRKALDADKNWNRTLIMPPATLLDAACSLSSSGLRIVLVVEGEQKRLLGTLSDGDIRRGLLRGLSATSCVTEAMNSKPLVVPEGVSPDLLRQIMVANKIYQVPAVTANGCVFDLHTWQDFEIETVVDAPMVIMAGGRGTRLRPHTETCPKPLLLVRGKPMLLHIIERAKAEGFYKFFLSVNYLGHMIESYFGNGQKFGVQIDYLREATPLGTAGALSLFDSLPSLPFVVTNCDVITDIRYAELLEFHNRHSADVTMAVRQHEWQHPFGVVNTDGLKVVNFEEKPIVRSQINAGVYAISPASLAPLIKGESCDIPQLFERLNEAGRKIICYPMHEPWLDVGSQHDLSQANREPLI